MGKIKTYSLLIILSVSASLYCQPDTKYIQEKISEDLFYTKIQDSVYMYTHYFPYACNGMFILLPDSQGVLINTPCESTGTISLLEWIEKSFGHLKLTAIVTGFHQDNLGGDEILLGRGIHVYGPDLTVQLLKEKGAELKDVIINSVTAEADKKYYNSYKALNLVPPDKIFSLKDGLRLEIVNETFEIYFPGESHTIDNTVVYIRSRKILFGGCMIKGMEYNSPGFTGFANMTEWPKSVENVMNKFKDSEIVVPGHGTIGGKELFPHMINVLKDWNKTHSSR